MPRRQWQRHRCGAQKMLNLPQIELFDLGRGCAADAADAGDGLEGARDEVEEVAAVVVNLGFIRRGPLYASNRLRDKPDWRMMDSSVPVLSSE